MELINKHKDGATEFPIDLDAKSAEFIRKVENKYEEEYGKEEADEIRKEMNGFYNFPDKVEKVSIIQGDMEAQIYNAS